MNEPPEWGKANGGDDGQGERHFRAGAEEVVGDKSDGDGS